ncbi:MAG: DUF2185 domain-containing protein [Candidatus Thermoplasmatota archaeon]|nr:DUF2185 domain-containing protein [Candidatus Thermoplasmatota archaeon]
MSKAEYYLEDIDKTAKKNPKEFFIPSKEERKSQNIGDIVRLHFVLNIEGNDLPRAERMWVEIFEKDIKGTKYKGHLTNQPQHLKSISIGDTINFEDKHIARTIIKKDDPRYIECVEKKAMVSEMVFSKNELVRFMYREETDREEDSGWRLFTGHESDEYSNDFKNIRLVDVGWLLDFDRTLFQPFKAGKNGEAFERENYKKGWIKVDDWESAE